MQHRKRRRRRPIYLGLFLLVVCLIFHACTSQQTSPTPTVPAPFNSFDVSIEAPSRVNTGEPVQLFVEVENTSNESLNLFGGGEYLDLLIKDESGQLVNAWSNKMFPLILEKVDFGPGEVKELTWEWDQSNISGNLVPPGDYSVQGRFKAKLTEGNDSDWVTVDSEVKTLRIEQ